MINTQYGKLNSSIATKQNVNYLTDVKENAMSKAGTVVSAHSNTDIFEYSTTEKAKYTEQTLDRSITYSKANAKSFCNYSGNGIYDSANYYSTSISLRQMAAQRANISCTSSGEPIINSGSLATTYSQSYNYLLSFTPIETYNHYSAGNIGKGSVEDTIFTYDHQYFLYSLTNNYESSSKAYYSERGYEIDAYLLMGIAYGESEALKSRTNSFGEAATLKPEAAEKAVERAIYALQDCGLAKNESAARSIMASDPFYEKAARVLSFMDNGIDYNTPLNVNYECLDNAMPNIERWRNAVATGSQNTYDYGYRWY